MSSQLSNLNLDDSFVLKVIFGGHFALVTFTLFGSSTAAVSAFYNAFFLLFVLWSHWETAEKSEFPLFYAFVVNAQSILFDIIVISSGYNLLTSSSKFG